VRMQEKTSRVGNAPSLPSDVPNSQIPEPVVEEFPKDARDWFAKLSVEERVATLGFEDAVALSVFAMLATSFSKSPLSSSSQPTAGSADRPKGVQIDWLSKIALADVEKAYSEYMQQGQDSNEKSDVTALPPTLAEENFESPINLSADTNNQDNNVLNRDVDTSEISAESEDQPAKTIEVLDDIRIPDDAIEPSDSIPNPAADDAGEQAQIEGESKHVVDVEKSLPPEPIIQMPSRLAELLDNLCLIVPSAFRLVTDQNPSGSLPSITLHPTYLRQINGDVLSTFDEAMRMYTSDSYSFFTPPSKASWIDTVRDAYTHSTANESSLLPLYSLLILRFHNSLFDAYNDAAAHFAENQNRATSNTTAKEQSEDAPSTLSPDSVETITTPNTSISTTIEADVVQPDSQPDVLRSEEPETSRDDAGNDTPASVGNAETSPDSTESLVLSSLLPNLVQYLGSFDHLGDEDMARLVDDFRLHVADLEHDIQRIEDMFLLPLALLIPKLATSSSELFEGINSGVVKTIKGQERQDHPAPVLDSEPKPVAESDEQGEGVDAKQTGEPPTEAKEVSEPPDQADPGVLQTVSQDGGSGKKGKKKKKKKKRKGSTGNAQANTKPGVHDRPSVAESEKTDDRQSHSRMHTEADITLAKAQAAVDNCTAVLETSTPPISPVKEKAVQTTICEDEAAPVIDTDAEPKIETMAGTGSSDQVEEKSDGALAGEQNNVNDEQEKEGSASEDVSNHEDDHSAWETVEVRSRGNRKKATDRNTQGRFGSYHGHSSGQHGSKKSKAPRSKETRKRTANRKMVREILAGVLDTVDEEVRKRRPGIRDIPGRFTGSRWPSASGRNQMRGSSGGQAPAEETRKTNGGQATMRDVLVGRQSNNSSKQSASIASARKGVVDRSRGKQGTGRFGFDAKRKNDKNDRASQVLGGKMSSGTPTADQNTATTVPETVSANSALLETTNARTAPPRGTVIARNDSSSGESIGEVKEKRTSQETVKEASPSPPLPTLLSPGNNNSASSSVASSLEAPHAVHHVNHHSSFLGSENDVGYHLLHVCDRLSRDIQIFMKRREYALEIRRRERSMVLEALQETLSTIWPGMCSVEMYGSCATELDLPSSDLDVVVCGLDRPVETIPSIQQGSIDPNQPQASDASTESKRSDVPLEAAHSQPDIQHHIQSGRPSPHQPQMPLMYGHLSLNADRVVRLAMELEMQPWAVHVKAIPTASVPVIKILADPARLNGAVRTETGEWLVQQTSSGQTNAVDSSATTLEATSGSTPMAGFPGSQSPPPWRGADVVNGLMKVDITFEGPEHGGIGSTKFSSRVVEEFCRETNQTPEQTPAVQVLMVLKELLAQRRLNEPFSGGLSSYALLLLVISVVRERAIIKEELERVERQRRIVAAGGGNSTLRVSQAEFVPYGKKQENHQTKPTGTRKKKKGDGSQIEDQTAKTAGTATQNTKTVPPSKPPVEKVEDISQAARLKEASKAGVASTPPAVAQQKTANKASRQAVGRDATVTMGKKPGGGVKPSSWASIAKKSTSGFAENNSNQESVKGNPDKKALPQAKPKVSSFADAVAKGTQTTTASAAGGGKQTKKTGPDEKKNRSRKAEGKQTTPHTPSGERPQWQPESGAASSAVVTPMTQNASHPGASPQKPGMASYSQDAGSSGLGPLFPQGFHDVTEVLCSGETTPGKLLMNFLLFYGQHFDSQSTAIDYSSTHQRDGNNNGYSHLSPYLQRRSAGSYDPMTGMLTVDPIVVYDPLEGAENNNVARSCFAWSSIRWVFAQSYMTLSSVVEMSASNTSAQGGAPSGKPLAPVKDAASNAYAPGGTENWSGPYIHDDSGNVVVDPSSSLLELLLAF